METKWGWTHDSLYDFEERNCVDDFLKLFEGFIMLGIIPHSRIKDGALILKHSKRQKKLITKLGNMVIGDASSFTQRLANRRFKKRFESIINGE